jgi:general stress protein 26
MARARKKPRTSEQKKLTKMMRGIDLCMMTTRGAGGTMHARPMSNNGEVDFTGDAWFFTWRDSQKVRELGRDPSVALSYVGGTKSAPVWISVTGTAKIVDDAEKKTELWLKELEQWFDVGPEDPAIVLIRVKASRAQWWSYKDGGDVRL